jgi:NADPH:quinone reductase-like Zn-dependent oxidoreductase
MQEAIPRRMRAAAFDRFGGPEVLHTESLPVPRLHPTQVLVRLDLAGVGVWDPEIRSGELELGTPGFPRVIGNDGAGRVIAVGAKARRFRPGDRVYCYAFDGGCYAEYAAVEESGIAPIPHGLSEAEAGALGADGITALRGLDDQLRLTPGESLLIYGASGGIGHLAVQLAKRMGARVLAAASGADGVALAEQLGADVAVDGKREHVRQAVRDFAPAGLDAALVLVFGETLEPALGELRKGGRVAHPHGVEPVPRLPEGVTRLPYDGLPSRDAFDRLDRLIGQGPFHVELGKVFPLDEAAEAHRAIARHHLGKLALRIH